MILFQSINIYFSYRESSLDSFNQLKKEKKKLVMF